MWGRLKWSNDQEIDSQTSSLFLHHRGLGVADNHKAFALIGARFDLTELRQIGFDHQVTDFFLSLAEAVNFFDPSFTLAA